MIKKIVAAFVLLFLSQSAFAVNVEELNTGFFTRFNDDCLNYYIETALKNNYDLKRQEMLSSSTGSRQSIRWARNFPR